MKKKIRRSCSGVQSLSGFMTAVTDGLERAGRLRTAEAYRSALHSFLSFRGGRDLSLSALDADVLMMYETWLKGRGACMNTVSFYMRILRAVYNRAADEGLVSGGRLFRRVYTGIDKTAKRAVTPGVMASMKALQGLSPSQDFARDMFLFSFYTRGMSFVDMAFLRKSDLRDGVLSYCRRKTGRRLFIRWEPCMQELVDRHPALPGSPYMLPIVTTAGNARKEYRNAMRLINNRLKDIATLLGLDMKLTLYAARHSWASIACSCHVPLRVISEGMGHDSEITTMIYLASLDHEAVDRANRVVLGGL